MNIGCNLFFCIFMGINCAIQLFGIPQRLIVKIINIHSFKLVAKAILLNL